ncbi:polyadenylate-binding protein-interacting protein 1 [Gadus chalcogrammus]|uniref:polyadenylate-binding protein-interacting protein 1 n=1 Tax=Gadus chalcogrammus TaxID=1042646 RepID=UPI0024C47A68|nr:polyadenylate-binding protein-interacting protein 1 [Gadus chalcogrammus]
MNDHFDRAPGAGRARMPPTSPGLAGGGDGDTKTSFFCQREPLRQPKTSPPFVENNTNSNDQASGDCRKQSKSQQPYTNNTDVSKGSGVDTLVVSSKLSASAPEFVPASASSYFEDPAYQDYDGSGAQDPSYQDYDGSGGYAEPTLAETVADFLGHLSSSPGSFDADVGYIVTMLNAWVTTEELLKDLVELIYTQSSAIPNFSYTGARLCNHLSQHLKISPKSGTFRQLLLQRCRQEFDHKDKAVKGDPTTRKSFHSFVLFLGELYLNLEVKSQTGPPNRADVLLGALRDLLDCLFSNPDDSNLICAVKLLKLTGSVLEDTWKRNKKSDMDKLVKRIENTVLDANCSRDVKQMLLKLVELRSSDWGRVHAAAAANYATPDNDPNYFMNEPTFYTTDGTPFTAADPEYSEKYQEILDREDINFPEQEENNGSDSYEEEEDDEMDPEIEEAFENFCLESEKERAKRQ